MDINYITQSYSYLKSFFVSKSISEIPKHEQTYEECLSQIKNNGELLYFIKPEFRTYEMCEAAVSQNGFSIVNVPHNILNDKIYHLALDNNYKSFGFFKDKITLSMFKKINEGYKKNKKGIITSPAYALKDYDLSEDICRYIIENDPKDFKYIKNKNDKLARFAISKDPYIIEYVNIQTDELCNLAVEMNYAIISKIKNITLELFKKVMELYIDDIYTNIGSDIVVKEDKTLVKLPVHPLYYIKDRGDICEEIYEFAIKNDPMCIKYINKQTLKLCELAMSLNKLCIFHINDKNIRTNFT